eukprot:TRINITY_DN2937_c0_g1_i7.p1 TRINITY_DN2937_c0_g1~~TRINITY_DN2937_c0_g1_i7.p1  ORF type:complete len:107 (+),score=12.16 TRINITY_DN2937_c0_g1_i7:384-704(+)
MILLFLLGIGSFVRVSNGLQACSASLSHLLTSLTHPLPICRTPVPFHPEAYQKPVFLSPDHLLHVQNIYYRNGSGMMAHIDSQVYPNTLRKKFLEYLVEGSQCSVG